MLRRSLFVLLSFLALIPCHESYAGGIKVTLKSDNGNYLARCNSCIPRGAYPDTAFVHVPETNVRASPWAQFTLELLSNGKYALKADSGNYLARCNGCIPGGAYQDSAFIHVPAAKLMQSPWAQFTLELLSNGKYALKADSGHYLARCNGCIPGGAYPDSVFVHVPVAALMQSPWAQWNIAILP